VTATLIIGSTAAVWAGEAAPDVDLRADCPSRWEGEPGGWWVVDSSVVLRATSRTADPSQGVRAWSLSLRPTGGASIVSAGAEATDLAEFLRADGYERTELTRGPDNEGAVSAVVLSFQSDAQLPLDRDVVVLYLRIQGQVPESGCKTYGIDFVDGLVGSGQPVANVVTCGQGVTRRDDGGELDDDADGAEACLSTFCAKRRFVRGDANGDALVNVSDTVFLLDFLFRDGSPPPCEQACDADSNDGVNLSDAIHLLNYLFQSGPAPGAPFPSCGRAAGSQLSCASAGKCEGTKG
jgi:hypothetical protein